MQNIMQTFLQTSWQMVPNTPTILLQIYEKIKFMYTQHQSEKWALALYIKDPSFLFCEISLKSEFRKKMKIRTRVKVPRAWICGCAKYHTRCKGNKINVFEYCGSFS
jgi:hypothetical protein